MTADSAGRSKTGSVELRTMGCCTRPRSSTTKMMLTLPGAFLRVLASMTGLGW